MNARSHNALAPAIIRQICRAGPTPQEGLVLLESVIAGCCVYVAAATTGGLTAQEVFELLAENVRPRIDDLCGKVLKPEGSA